MDMISTKSLSQLRPAAAPDNGDIIPVILSRAVGTRVGNGGQVTIGAAHSYARRF